MLLGLATLASVMRPVSAASIHTTTAPSSSVRSMNKRQRRAFGECSNNSKRRREGQHHNICDDDDLHDNIRINFTPVPMSEEDDDNLDIFMEDISDGCEPGKDNDNLDTFIG